MRAPALVVTAVLAIAPLGCGGDGGGRGSSGGEWVARADMPGGPRQETAVVQVGGEVFVLGGFDATGTILARVEAYDPANDTWRDIPDLPVAMHHANAAVADGKIIVAGFLTGMGFVADGRCFAYDPIANEWTDREPMPVGTERGASGVAAIDERVYVIGGLRDGGAVADVSDYDVLANTWTPLEALPAARDHLGSAAIDGILYAVGGRNGTVGGHVAELLAFDPAGAGTWVSRAPMPTSRGGISAAALGGRLYVFGGEGNPDDPRGVFDAAEAWEPATDAWTELAPMTTPRHGTGAAAVNDRIWVPGGADEELFAAVATNEAYVPEPE